MEYKILLIWTIISLILVPDTYQNAGATNEEIQEEAVYGLLRRLIPSKIGKIVVTIDFNLSVNSKDVVQVKTIDDKLHITGSSGVAAAWGLNHYLKYYCGCQVSWTGDQLNLPLSWPSVDFTLNAIDRYRYYYNVCTESYSLVWWNWTRWQREIDLMVLNGINLPLAFTGQEYITLKTFEEFGLNQSVMQNYFTGPAFLAWGRMGNIQSWAGPLPMSWIINQFNLQRLILKRMRSFGIIPVLPGFSGHIPKEFKLKFPKAEIYNLQKWGHFKNPNYTGTFFLDPSDPIFGDVGRAYVRNIIKYFGTNHIYNIDLFNEMSPKSSLPEYIENISQNVYNSLKDVDPEAIWITQGWMFFSDPLYWLPSQVKALTTSVPIGKMIILDLTAEQYPQYQRFESFYGQTFIWCNLNNYGGVSGMFGNFQFLNEGPFKARSFPNSSMIGTGMAPEAIGKNYVIYDFMTEMAWRKEPTNVTDWVRMYASRRYGTKNKYAFQAWDLLKIWFDAHKVFDAWKLFNQYIQHEELNDRNITDTFSYDLVDVVRESLQLIFSTRYQLLVRAYHNKNVQKFRTYSIEMKNILKDLDDMLKTNNYYLLGTWIYDALNKATNSKERILYEMNAKNQVTIWGPDGEILDYAVKQWAGLFNDYFLPRWSMFIDIVQDSLKTGKRFNQSQYRQKVFDAIEKPFTLSHKIYPHVTKGSAIDLSLKLYSKYRRYMENLER